MQTCCPLFQAVLEKVGRRRSLEEQMRSAVLSFVFKSFRELYESILTDRCFRQTLPALAPDGHGTKRQGEHRYERLQSADL